MLDMKECCVFAYESATELKEGFFHLGVKRFETIFNVDMLNEISLIKLKGGCRALRKL